MLSILGAELVPEPTDIPSFLADPAFRDGGAAGITLSSTDPDPVLRFFDAVRAAVMNSFDKFPLASPGQPSVFLRAEHPRQVRHRLGANSRLIDLDLKSPDAWNGQLLVVAENATYGWMSPIGGSVEDAFDLIEEAGLGTNPVAIVYPVDRVMSCFVFGAQQGPGPFKIALPAGTRPVTLDDLIAVIDEFRRAALLTPQVCPPELWVDAENHVPTAQLERYIQWGVAVTLRSSFRPIQADIEQTTPVGRIDICLTNTRATVGVPLYPAIVELKALRSRTSNGVAVRPRRNLLAVLSGHRQAKAYRVQKQAALGLLACFDARSPKDDILAHPYITKAREKYFDDQMRAHLFNIYADPDEAQEELAA